MKSIAKLIQQGVSGKTDLRFGNFVLRGYSAILVWQEVDNFLNKNLTKFRLLSKHFEANRVWLFAAETSA